MRLRPLATLLLVLGVGNPAAADDLGRLFTTPTERARIDAVRKGGAPPATDTETSARAAAGDHLVVNGSVIGSDGKRLIWLNGIRAGHGDHVRLQRDGRVRVHWRNGVRVLKPGQVLDRASGEVFEGYARPHDPKLAPVSAGAPASPPTEAATGSAVAPGTPG